MRRVSKDVVPYGNGGQAGTQAVPLVLPFTFVHW
jgi:hypothetical protein